MTSFGRTGPKTVPRRLPECLLCRKDGERRQQAFDMGHHAANAGCRVNLDIGSADGTMDSNEFWIGRSLGAKAKNYRISLPNGEYVSLTEVCDSGPYMENKVPEG